MYHKYILHDNPERERTQIRVYVNLSSMFTPVRLQQLQCPAIYFLLFRNSNRMNWINRSELVLFLQRNK